MLIRGVELELHPFGEALSDHIRRENDFYEIEILSYLEKHFPVHRTIVDIGANIGNHTVFFANFLPHRNIVAFEPLEANLKLLYKNITRYPNTHVRPFAIGDKKEKIRMTERPDNMGMSGYDIHGNIIVQAYPLDYFYLGEVTLLKIDVENYEERVLA